MNLITICILLTLSGICIAQQDDICNTENCVETAALISSSIDHSVNPCDDFYQYSCGEWQKDHPMINNLEGWSHFSKLNHEMADNLIKLLSESTVEKEPKYLHPLLNFFKGCVNTNNRNSHQTRDFETIKTIIKQIGGWPVIDTLWNESNYTYENALIQINKYLIFKLILDIQVIPDLKNNTKPMIAIINPFTPTPSIEGIYRIPKEEEEEKKIYSYYDIVKSPAQQVAEALKGTTILDTTWSAEMKEVQSLDMALRTIATPLNSRNYVLQNYSSLIIHAKDLNTFPGINLRKIVEGILMADNIVLNDNDEIFADIEYLKHLGPVLHNSPKRAFANLIATNVALIYAKHTSTSMLQMLGTPDLTVLPRVCIAYVEQTLPDLIGRYFMDKKFAKESVKDMKELIATIKEAFHKILQENTWMDDTTKANSIKKLDAISEHIAFPEFLSNDAALQEFYSQVSNISESTFLDSIIKVLIRQRSINSKLLREAIPLKGHWPVPGSPVIVNAFYNPEFNGIFFPAGIAQFPFFNHGRPMTFNLGAIGMVIAHELTHAFDNLGSLFDERGNLANWMTSKSRTTFNEKANCFVDQYNHFRYSIGNNAFVNISGLRTLGENIADNGGARIAYRAFELHKAKNGGKLPKLPGNLSKLSPEQMFFMTFANLWCSNKGPAAISNQISRDPHSIENARVIGSLSNFDEFAKAFNCPVGSRMNPTHKCQLW